MSTQIDLGPVLSVPKGDWNATTTYERLNIVRHNSASWICNVAISKGVEPTEGSTDWYLQVKDTSSVSSVNGMKGDVEITSIQTPSNDSNDTSIANTEWIRDRIDETISSAHSYTDSAISTATTSILDTAAQDASNKAAIAINQALAASEAKFAVKEIVNNLADNVNALTENDVAQDKAIDGKLDKSGGTMTGMLVGTAYDQMCSSIDQSVTPSENKYGSSIRFLDKNKVPVGRMTVFRRAGGTTVLRLTSVSPDGTNGTHFDILTGDGVCSVQLGGQDLLTTAGGTLTGSLRVPNILRGQKDSTIGIYGGNAWREGAYLELGGPNAECPDTFSLHYASSEIVGTENGLFFGDNLIFTPEGVITSSVNNALTVSRDSGETTAVRAENTNTGKAVRFGVGASGTRGIYDESTSSWLISYSASGDKLMSKGANVYTSADGFLLNSSNMDLWYATSATLPSGGSWVVFGIRCASNGTISDTLFNRYAGGTTVTLGGSGQGYILAWRVA